MIAFHSLALTDFMSINDASMTFNTDEDQQSITLVKGKNADSLGADDNGAGKSSLFEGLRWVLYGETVKQSLQSMTVDHVIRNGHQSAVGKLVMSDAAKQVDRFEVYRVRSRTGGKLTAAVAMVGCPLRKFSGAEAQSQIEQFLGLDKVQFSNLVHLCGSYPKLFARATDQERKDILAQLVDIACVSNAQETIKASLADLDKKIGELDNTRLSNEAKVDVLRDEYKSKKLKIARIEEEIKAGEKGIPDLEKSIKEKEKEYKLAKKRYKLENKEKDKSEALDQRLVEITQDRLSVMDSIHTIRQHYLPLEQKIKTVVDEAQTQATVTTRQLTEVDDLIASGACPTCRQKTNTPNMTTLSGKLKKHLADFKDAHEEALKKQKDIETRKLAEIKVCEDKLDELKGEEKALLAKKKKIKEAASSVDLQAEMRKAETALSQARARLDKASGELDLRRDMLEETEKEKKEARKKAGVLIKENKKAAVHRAVFEEQKKELNFWKVGFSSRGVPSLYIETVLPRISKYIQKYADILSGGDIRVALKAYKETKSGTTRESIQIEAKNIFGADQYGGNSTGEKHRIDLAVTLGLIDYFRDLNVFQSNLLVTDEVFDGLDTSGTQKAVKALRASGIPNVFVISHSIKMSEQFDAKRVVYKKDGVSSIGPKEEELKGQG